MPVFDFSRGPAAVAAVVLAVGPAVAQESVRLREAFEPTNRYRVEVSVELDGRMSVPVGKGEAPKPMTVVGTSALSYDERPLSPDEPNTGKTLRQYRTVEFRRAIGDRDQRADVRKDVRRMVVIRSEKGKSPFSPDGPLTWNEIDVVRNDFFVPALVPGLLPDGAVRVGDSWKASPDAVRELTEVERIDSGQFTLTLTAFVTLDGRRHAKLSLSGTVRGVDDHGPCRHTLDGSAFFDLTDNRLAYLTAKGTHELLDGGGKVAGRIDGRFKMTRTAISDGPPDRGDLKPTAENTLLFYDNPDLGVRLLYPRRWRVGAVQGKQLTLDGPNGAGMLLTVEPRAKLPTATAYLREAEEFLRKEKGTVANVSRPERVRETPALDRFGLDAELGGEALRMEYAVLAAADGGLTLAARLPRQDAAILAKDADQISKSIEIRPLAKAQSRKE